MPGASRAIPVTGFLLAVGSAASFALSGIFASALLDAGWSAGAAATTRITLAALVLAAPTVLALRGQWNLVRAAWRPILLFGLLAVAGCQLAFFLAVQFIPPSLALLIEFMGPVVLMLWLWSRTRVAPAGLTLVGAAVAVLGLVAISGSGSGGALHPLGIAFALVAAIGNAAYYAAGANSDHGIPPIPFVGLGLAVGAVVLGLASATGLLPFAVTGNPAVIAGAELPPAVAVAGMVLISTVLSYVLGVAASRRLGATVASFTGYSEAMFGIVWTIVLLAVVPTRVQWLGAALIIAGVVAVKAGEILRARGSQRPG
ncbi:EamA family transporter [Leucobacter tenebrionis]|uniref:EamA family transporter n=1 Tax=Leucobacter tenebrionis TaxID=2873270 RepID=UPI001CA60DE6|nr:EamA family transporter [Leucobacter tenebrionis]QZY52340.1 EamA family transporter [Leucobacter tenebrionis]